MRAPLFEGRTRDVAEENIQARLAASCSWRSRTSSASSLTTGNKSEMSVGYATLYGDMLRWHSSLKDIYKTEV